MSPFTGKPPVINPAVPARLRVGPVEGRQVRDPATGEPITGEESVADNSYYRRRIAKGDLRRVARSDVRRASKKKDSEQ